ncbi:PL29 family lyase N-terminal domain-containing protein [Bacteroides finegoldii]|uniref:PL29 family lyase N-terminal domain-containing protein n=1 Tax=Bacteroides TaxID=816 RepID=UPI0018997BA3|nr:PL29 family lyase N-terminal domain-containing protein [Bacteroides finegoldii]
MKYIKSYILFFLMVFAVTGCTTDDLKDDVNNLKDRVTLIEEQVKLLNDNLAVVAYILDPQNKTIANVETPTKDQYVITLSNGEKLTLTIGKPGTIDEPEITIGEDGMWYVNGESTGVVAVGTDGKNGEGYPEFRVEQGKWQVRFGDGAWSDVEGGDVTGGVSLGDQIFESAEVDGNKFIVTLKKDGSVHTLPIVETLKCIIDKSGLTLDKEDFLVVNRDERVIVPVQIEGENMQVTCPQGWRATLNKLDVVDEKGNNYQLYIFAPVSDVKAMTRAVADNTADVTVQVQKGAFWAVDKIKVKVPKVYDNDWDKYNDGLPVTVGGFDISLDTYNAATEITEDYAITKAGVYFVSANNVTLTLKDNTMDNLIILPYSDKVTAINLNISAQLTVTNTFICKNVVFTSTVNNNILRFNGVNANVVFDGCKINGLKNTKALMVPQTAGTHNLNYCAIVNSDIRIEETEAEVVANAGIALVNNMDCSQLFFENNLVYATHSVVGDTGKHLVNFKLFSGNNRVIESELYLNSNTFVDVETSGGSGVTGLVYCKSIGTLTVKRNLFYLTFPTLNFVKGDGTPVTSKATVMLRVATAIKDVNATGDNNYAYNGNSAMSVKIWYLASNAPTRPNSLSEFTIDEIFDVNNQDTFDKLSGIFIPKDKYKAYGAQR